MKFVSNATLTRRNGFAKVLLALSLGLLPVFASAEGEHVSLKLTQSDKGYLFLALGAGVLSVVVGLFLASWLRRLSPGTAKMQEVGSAIREGAKAYLVRQMKTMVWFVAFIGLGLFFLYKANFGPQIAAEIAICFVLGVAASYAAGLTGMLMAVEGNMRTAEAAKSKTASALQVAFRSGAVTGLMTAGLGLTGASLIFLFGSADAMKLLVGFGFGGSLAALFMRVGGGIFTKAADVGADLVGKVEAGIPEDDPRNPAVIADNVGDNVGDCAGMAADVFESYAVTLVATIVLGASTASIFPDGLWMKLVTFALLIYSAGIIASIMGIFVVSGKNDADSDALKSIRKGFYLAAAAIAIFVGAGAFLLFGGSRALVSKTLKPIEAIQNDEFKQILQIRQEVAEQRGVPTYMVSADDVTSSDLAKKLADTIAKTFGIKQDEALGIIKAATPQAFGTRVEDLPTPPDLSEYRPIDFSNDQDPVLKYATADPAATPSQSPNQPPKVVEFKDAFGVQSGNSWSQAPMFLYKVSIHSSAPGAGQSKDQVVTVGPLLETVFNKLVNDPANPHPNVDIQTIAKWPATLYESPSTNEVAVAIDGPIDPIQIQRQPLNYYKASVEEVEKAAGDPNAQRLGQMPDEFQTKFASTDDVHISWGWLLAPVLFGVLLAFGIEKLTDYYVSTGKRPVQEVAEVSSAGAAPMIIQGFSYGLESSVFMVLCIVVALLVPLWIFPPAVFHTYLLSFYGIALVGLGLLSTTGFILAMDTFGPISDNAQGVFEMSGEASLDPSAARVVAQLDAAGNTTKALTKGFAITTAVIASVALFHSFLADSHLAKIGIRLDVPEIFLGFLIGGAAPFLFSAFSINAVGRAAFQLITEVRRQFRGNPGIMTGESKPDYGACVSIVTAAAQRELLGPGVLAICLPVAVGFGFSIGKPATEIGGHYFNLSGAEALGGFLAGAILTGQLMAVLLANSGGLWDNAKKLIEDGLYGGKGSEAHKASVVCDTVGDPFKDTAGPALNPLIKVMNLVALLLAPAFIAPYGDKTLTLITSICVVALAGVIIWSKRHSLSEGLADGRAHGPISTESTTDKETMVGS